MEPSVVFFLLFLNLTAPHEKLFRLNELIEIGQIVFDVSSYVILPDFVKT